MTRADCKTLRSAALELAAWRRAIGSSPNVERAVAKHDRLIKKLREIAAREQRALQGPKTT